ncbi:MAG TPA: acetylglutamate kinase [Bacillales bacterium]|nr:acetylglutamate kinase [Bacillales bacterium]
MKNIVVIKCGGSTIETLSDDFFQSVGELRASGYAPVLVHGGGPAIKRMLSLLKVKSEFVNGLRKTDEQVMAVVEMVLSGTVNKMLVRKLGQAGLEAVGLSGSDSRLIEAVPLDEEKLGLVGEVANVNTKLIDDLLERGTVPVIAPVGIGQSGRIYNINADTAAGAVGTALKAEKLLFVTDVPGILKKDQLLKNVTEAEVRGLIRDGTISGGMIPKVEAALKSLSGELKEVMITAADAKIVKNGEMAGTTIQKNEKVTVK